MKYRATFILWTFFVLSEQFDDRIVIAVTNGINFEVDTDMCRIRDIILVHRSDLLFASLS